MRVEERQIFTVLLSSLIAYPEIIWDELATSDAHVGLLMSVAEQLSLLEVESESLGNLDRLLKAALPGSAAAHDIIDEIVTCVGLSGPILQGGGLTESTFD